MVANKHLKYFASTSSTKPIPPQYDLQRILNMFRHEYADDADDADDELPPLEYDDNEYTSPQHIPLPSSPDNDRAPRIDGAPPTLRRKTSFERVEEFIDSLGRDSTPAASHERRSTSDSYDQLPPLPRTRYWARRVVSDDEDEDATSEGGFQDKERVVETPKQRRARTGERIRQMRERREAAVPIASRSTAFARFFSQLPNARFGTGQRQSLPSRSAMAVPAIPSYYNSSTHQRIDRKKEEIDRMENVLLPVCVNLSLLQNTRIPPYNPHIKAKSTPEVLKAKVLPIGKHILNVLKKEPEEKRGALEMAIW